VAKTVAQGFQELRSRLEITNLQSSAVSKRHQNIREILKKELPVLENNGDFLTGSYVRNTMIAPVLATWHIRSKNKRFWSRSFVLIVTFLERMY